MLTCTRLCMCNLMVICMYVWFDKGNLQSQRKKDLKLSVTRFWYLRNCYRVSCRYSTSSTDTWKQRKLETRSKLPAFSKMSTNFTNDSLRSQGNCESSEDSSRLKIGKLFLLSIILTFGLVGNVLIITLVRVREELRRTINSFIVNMAASDLLPILLMPFSLKESAANSSNYQWPIGGKLGSISCRLSIFLVAVSMTVSVQSLLWISLDRFMAVVMPLKAHLISSRFRAFAITSTWIVAVIINSIDLCTTKLVEYDANFYCIREEITSWTINIFAYGRIVLVSIAPLIVITVLYSAIAVTLRRQNISLRCTAVKKNDQRKRRAVKMSLCIIVSFNLCLIPNIVFGMAYLSEEKFPCSVNVLLGFFSVLGIYLSSTTNPLICFIFVKNYRRGLGRLFSLCPSKRRDTQNMVRERKMDETGIQIIEFNKLRKTDESPWHNDL